MAPPFALFAVVLGFAQPAQAQGAAGAQLEVAVTVIRSCRVLANDSHLRAARERTESLLSAARAGLDASCGSEVDARVSVHDARVALTAQSTADVLDIEF